MIKPVLACLAAIALACPAAAQDAAGLYNTCFMRIYDSAHMQSHPGQRVVQIQAAFQQNEENLWAGVYYTRADGQKFGLSGDCYEKISGGFLCHVCANDSCDQTGETFKVLWSGGATLDLVNDTTGLSGRDAQGGDDRLPAGGGNGVFRLDHLSDPTACDWLPR
jgi:hypothetical protein